MECHGSKGWYLDLDTTHLNLDACGGITMSSITRYVLLLWRNCAINIEDEKCHAEKL